MAYETFTTEALPVSGLGNIPRINEYLPRVMALDLPGLALTGAGVQFDSTEAIASHLTAISTYKFADANESLIFSKEVWENDTLGLHWDPDSAPPKSRQINVTLCHEGAVRVSLFAFQPVVASAITRRSAVYYRSYYTEAMRRQFRLGKVDTDLVVPHAYTADLHSGDGFVFPDAMTVHDFTSLIKPRRSSAHIFNVRL